MDKTGDIEKEIFKKASAIAKEIAMGKDVYISKGKDGVNIKTMDVKRLRT